MKLNNYPTYSKKDWKNNKGRFVNKQTDPTKFILPIDDVSIQLLNYFVKIKKYSSKSPLEDIIILTNYLILINSI